MAIRFRAAVPLALACASLGCGPGPSSGGAGAQGPTVFFEGPFASGPDLWRAELGRVPEKIALPKELGDNNHYLAAHFSSPRTGVALVFDQDGAAANVLTFEAATNGWKSVAFITDPEVIARMPTGYEVGPYWSQRPNVPTFFARSWNDGSFVVAVAMTDGQFGQSVWSVTSVGGAAPVERVSPLSTANVPELDPSRQMYLNVVGAPTAFQLNAVAFSRNGAQPAHAAYVSFDLATGEVEAHDLPGVSGIFGGPGYRGDDYFVAETAPGADPTDWISNRITRYCRETTCSSPQHLTQQHVDGFPYVVLDSSRGPLPWVKLGDLRSVEPTPLTIRLPTASTELDLKAALPDPQKPGMVRLIGYDSDIAQKAVEFRFDPETGAVTPVATDAVTAVDTCLATYAGNRCGLLSFQEPSGLSDLFFAFPSP